MYFGAIEAIAFELKGCNAQISQIVVCKQALLNESHTVPTHYKNGVLFEKKKVKKGLNNF